MRTMSTLETEVDEVPHAADVRVFKRVDAVIEVDFPGVVDYCCYGGEEGVVFQRGETKVWVTEGDGEVFHLVEGG